MWTHGLCTIWVAVIERNDSALAAYRNCMTEHGVNVTSGPTNTADPTYAAAEKVCAALRPTQNRGPTE
jgi:hypothetical protein